jgi:hypothetical protein
MKASDDGSGLMIAGSVAEVEAELVLREGVWRQEMTQLAHRAELDQRAGIDRIILERIRYRVYSYLCASETELALGAICARSHSPGGRTGRSSTARAKWAGAFMRSPHAPESFGWIVGRRPSQGERCPEASPQSASEARSWSGTESKIGDKSAEICDGRVEAR